DSGLAMSRASPIVRRSRFELERQRVMLGGLDLATRNLRIIARRIEWVLRDGRSRPQVADMHARIAVAPGPPAAPRGDVWAQPVARQAFAEIARHLDPVAILPDGPVGDRNTITALRPYLVDLLPSTGLALAAARRL